MLRRLPTPLLALACLLASAPAAKAAADRPALPLVPRTLALAFAPGRAIVQWAPELANDEAPEAPLLTTTDPVSPASDAAPKIIGSAEAGTSVDVYSDAGCEGLPVADGPAAELASPGIEVVAAPSSTSQFFATATDAAENVSACSQPISYTNSTKILVIGPGEVIVDPLREPLPTIAIPAAIVPPPVIPLCRVPKLAGKALGQARAALSGGGCRVGKVNKPKARKGRKPLALVVKSSSPAAGSLSSGPVDLMLGAKPKKPRH